MSLITKYRIITTASDFVADSSFTFLLIMMAYQIFNLLIHGSFKSEYVPESMFLSAGIGILGTVYAYVRRKQEARTYKYLSQLELARMHAVGTENPLYLLYVDSWLRPLRRI